MIPLASLQQLFFALVFICISLAHSTLDYETAVKIIQESKKIGHVEGDKPNHFPLCSMTNTESCDITAMKPGISTLVQPNRGTRCIYSDSGPYKFQVIPGDLSKLMVYFQGGGACWDEISDKLGFCTSECIPQSMIGIFDRNDERNEYKDYTIIHAMYCSGLNLRSIISCFYFFYFYYFLPPPPPLFS